MTDEQIIKALECCLLSNEQQVERCAECPMDETPYTICQNILAYHALDLINRQKAEIERLKAENEGKDFYLDVKKDAHKMSIGVMAHYTKSIKAEAITAFHEKVKKRCIEGGIYPAFVNRQMEAVKKEMMGAIKND